jgi:hypothetical protein
MATSGSDNGNHVSDGNEYVYVTWSLVSQSIANNTSTISWKFGWHFTTYSCRGLRLGKVLIHGATVYSDSDSGDGVHAYNSGHDHRPQLQIASGTHTMDHNSSGALTFGIASHLTGYNGQLSSQDGDWTLPVIPQLWDAPSLPVISSVASTSAFVSFSDGGGGVGAVDSRQIAYGTSTSVGSATIVSSDGSTSITGLSTGTTYYVWARVHNAAGYSPWSSRASFTTLRVPFAPTTPVISNVKPTTADVAWTPNGNGGSAITGYDIGYGTSPSSPTTTIAVSSSPVTVTGLTPGTTYYFWVRAKNVVGNSAWSGVASTMSISGVRINVAGEWKLAVPYVRTGGIWKLSRPYVKALGVWKETT